MRKDHPVKIQHDFASAMVKRMSSVWSFLRNCLSSCEPGWISQAFLWPAVLGSVVLMLYVDNLPYQPLPQFDVTLQEDTEPVEPLNQPCVQTATLLPLSPALLLIR